MKQRIWIYRYDLSAIGAIIVLVLLYILPLYGKGQIVFSDLDFGGTSQRYMEEIAGVWNERWSTSTLLNAPRLLYILPFYLLSLASGDSGPVLLKSFITCVLLVSALSMYLFTKRLVSVYFSRHFTFVRIIALLPGALFYALNPWVIFRIQHVYLLCGYSLFPLVLMFFLNAFDPKFQMQRIPNYNFHRLYRANVVDLFLLAAVFTVSAAAIHYFFYGLLYLAMLTILLLIKLSWIHRKSGRADLGALYRNFLLKGAIFGLFFGLLSFYWLSLYFGSILMGAQVSQHNINVVDTLTLFSRNSSPVNVLYMISYWWPMFPLSSLPLSFYICGGVLLALIGWAMLSCSLRYSLILMFTLLTVLFTVIATGVNIPLFAGLFVQLVTKTPVIGSIFRDPNKIVGLIAVNFSVLLSFGLLQALDRLKRPFFGRVFKPAAVLAVVCCLWVYAQPLRDTFINGYYKPVKVPDEYSQLAAKLPDSTQPEDKVLYFPVADNMVQSSNGVATPVWNKGDTWMEKATGDFQVYSSPANTLFHHEGNEPSITYYINFLQYLLDNGFSSKLGKLFVPFGINQLVYHHEYTGQEMRQAFNVQLLDAQQGLKNTYSNPYFTLYQLADKLPYMSVIPHKVVTPYGFGRMEGYSHQPGFEFSKYGVLFQGLNPALPLVQTVNEGDYVEAASFNDLLLSQLPADHYLYPFDAIEDGNPFLKWSKTLLSNNDWLWYLASRNIHNYAFDMDLNAGTAVTFATSKLDVPAYMLDRITGSTVLDFNKVLQTDAFFTPDNPELFSVQAAPRGLDNTLPVLHGEIVEGKPDNIWQVAKSGLMETKESNPYQFSITASGRGTNKLHFKVRFYNASMEELDISYVVAPTTENNFDGARFYGEFVTPPETKWMRIDLLTQQRPEQKSYWWIHDMKLVDLGAYKKPNTFVMHKTVAKRQLAQVYARVFVNRSGGTIRVAFPDGTVDVPTQDASLNQFQWVDLGQHLLPKGEVDISVTNLKGFNAVNVLAIVPEEEREGLALPVRQAVDRGKLFMLLEAENDFAGSGNVQSERAYPELSMGRGISYQDGELRRSVEILKTGDYSAALLANIPAAYPGMLTVTFTNKATGAVVKRSIRSGPSQSGHSDTDKVIETDNLQDIFAKKLISLPTVLLDYTRKEIGDMYLTKGSYTLSITFKSAVPSLSSVKDFHLLDSKEVKLAAATEDSGQTPSQGNPKISLGTSEMRQSEGQLELRYSSTLSSNWYTYASAKMPAAANEEYLVRFDAISENAPERHLKAVFLNKNSEILATAFIDEIEESYKKKWNHYEQILKAPEGTAFMQLQVLARGDAKADGSFRMKNYSVIPYKGMIMLDQFLLAEGNDAATFFITPPQEEKMNFKRQNAMSRSFTLNNPEHKLLLINEIESPNPLWEFELNGDKQRARIAVNGVTTGFITSESGSGTVVIILRRHYWLGIGLLVVGVLAGGMYMLPLSRSLFKNRKLERSL
ncbi:hypothetical protein [Paenibacillus sp. HW567]|uniref:hypothetical protein n=1 Tax=Paenibacillus sp. HW567 TaxID=1034769 RepID=UPI0003753BF5|nr:hypothetical protein [Paenibacillus sp. HW567]